MVAILLCTFNGETYLKAQLDSLFSQTYKKIKVFVHDDGSEDMTLSIIQQYEKKYPNKICVVDDLTKHRGAGASFMWLLNNVNSEYYMFCDQDDVWLSTKIENTLKKMKDVELSYPNTPVLIHTDLVVVDSSLNEVCASYWNYKGFKVDVSKHKQYLGFGNIVTGCTMLINQKVKEFVFPYNTDLLHDYWIALNVAKNGIIDNLKQQTILYRQHGRNEAGVGLKYMKRHISIDVFFVELKDEILRSKECAGYGIPGWLYYRIKYFFYRHF